MAWSSAAGFLGHPDPTAGRWDRESASILEEQQVTNAASDQIYCLKCRSKTDILETQEVVLKNGRSEVTGRCSACGTKKFRIGAAKK